MVPPYGQFREALGCFHRFMAASSAPASSHTSAQPAGALPHGEPSAPASPGGPSSPSAAPHQLSSHAAPPMRSTTTVQGATRAAPRLPMERSGTSQDSALGNGTPVRSSPSDPPPSTAESCRNACKAGNSAIPLPHSQGEEIREIAKTKHAGTASHETVSPLRAPPPPPQLNWRSAPRNGLRRRSSEPPRLHPPQLSPSQQAGHLQHRQPPPPPRRCSFDSTPQAAAWLRLDPSFSSGKEMHTQPKASIASTAAHDSPGLASRSKSQAEIPAEKEGRDALDETASATPAMHSHDEGSTEREAALSTHTPSVHQRSQRAQDAKPLAIELPSATERLDDSAAACDGEHTDSAPGATEEGEGEEEPGRVFEISHYGKRSTPERHRPSALRCYSCGREYGKFSLSIHSRACVRQHALGLGAVLEDPTVPASVAKRNRCAATVHPQ